MCLRRLVGVVLFQVCMSSFSQARKTIKIRKNTINTANTLIISQRLDVTVRRYLSSSVCAPSMCCVASSTFASILNSEKKQSRIECMTLQVDLPVDRFFLLSYHGRQLGENIAKFNDCLFNILHRFRTTG